MPANKDEASLELLVNKYIAQIDQYITSKKEYVNYSDSSDTGSTSLIQSARLLVEKSFSINNFELTKRKVEAASKFLEVIKEALAKFLNLSKDTPSEKQKELEHQMVTHMKQLVAIHINELHAVRESFNKPSGSYDEIIQNFASSLIVLRTSIEYSMTVEGIDKTNELMFGWLARNKPAVVATNESVAAPKIVVQKEIKQPVWLDDSTSISTDDSNNHDNHNEHHKHHHHDSNHHYDSGNQDASPFSCEPNF